MMTKVSVRLRVEGFSLPLISNIVCSKSLSLSSYWRWQAHSEEWAGIFSLEANRDKGEDRSL